MWSVRCRGRRETTLLPALWGQPAGDTSVRAAPSGGLPTGGLALAAGAAGDRRVYAETVRCSAASDGRDCARGAPVSARPGFGFRGLLGLLVAALVLLRARWQVELLFKLWEWKDHGQVDPSTRGKPGRVLGEVYAKLLAMVVQHGLLLTGCWALPQRSLPKAAHTIRPQALHLARVLACTAQRADPITLIHRCLAAGCRLNRRNKTPSTFHLLDLALGGLG